MEAFDCELYMDLMPLVKDGAASGPSRTALELHLMECESCRALYDSLPDTGLEPDEGRVKSTLDTLRDRYRRLLVALVAGGILVGALLTFTRNMYLTVGLFPLLGLAAYFVWRARSLFAPLVVFSVAWIFQIVQGGNPTEAVSWAFYYAYACVVGVVAGGVIAFIFDKPGWRSRLLRLLAVILVLVPIGCAMYINDIAIGGNAIFRETVEIRAQEYLDQEYPGQGLVIQEVYSNTPLLYDFSVTIGDETGRTLFVLSFDGIWPEPEREYVYQESP